MRFKRFILSLLGIRDRALRSALQNVVVQSNDIAQDIADVKKEVDDMRQYMPVVTTDKLVIGNTHITKDFFDIGNEFTRISSVQDAVGLNVPSATIGSINSTNIDNGNMIETSNLRVSELADVNRLVVPPWGEIDTPRLVTRRIECGNSIIADHGIISSRLESTGNIFAGQSQMAQNSITSPLITSPRIETPLGIINNWVNAGTSTGWRSIMLDSGGEFDLFGAWLFLDGEKACYLEKTWGAQGTFTQVRLTKSEWVVCGAGSIIGGVIYPIVGQSVIVHIPPNVHIAVQFLFWDGNKTLWWLQFYTHPAPAITWTIRDHTIYPNASLVNTQPTATCELGIGESMHVPLVWANVFSQILRYVPMLIQNNALYHVSTSHGRNVPILLFFHNLLAGSGRWAVWDAFQTGTLTYSTASAQNSIRSNHSCMNFEIMRINNRVSVVFSNRKILETEGFGFSHTTAQFAFASADTLAEWFAINFNEWATITTTLNLTIRRVS